MSASVRTVPVLSALRVAAVAAFALGLGPVVPLEAQTRRGELRCGWFDNPSAGNSSLFDKDGEWTIAVQGGHQTAGDWPPKFSRGQFVRKGPGSYGYGCACLRVDVDAAENNIVRIFSGNGRPLSVCRRDQALKALEDQLK
jgi:hypothetical protein